MANPDGTDWRIIPRCFESHTSGTWSPDGNRIVCMGPAGDRIMVVDIAAGSASGVAEGRAAIWLDQLTLLVEDL